MIRWKRWSSRFQRLHAQCLRLLSSLGMNDNSEMLCGRDDFQHVLLDIWIPLLASSAKNSNFIISCRDSPKSIAEDRMEWSQRAAVYFVVVFLQRSLATSSIELGQWRCHGFIDIALLHRDRILRKLKTERIVQAF
jgi:hypothetical protein